MRVGEKEREQSQEREKKERERRIGKGRAGRREARGYEREDEAKMQKMRVGSWDLLHERLTVS